MKKAAPMHPELETLRELWEIWTKLGWSLAAEDFDRQSLCEDWTVKEVFAHHSQAVRRLDQFVGEPTDLPVDHANATSFFNQFNLRPDDAGLVRDMAKKEALDATVPELIAEFADHGPRAIEKAHRAGDIVVQTDEGRIHIYDYVRTRTVESVIHLIDVYRPLGLPPVIPLGALDRTAEVLLNFMDRVEFIEASTGRSGKKLFPVFW
jgi:uncharacterized protein (TIGR03083 family)